jgi:hypothetical protein
LYLYGELPLEGEERIEQHLEDCEACRGALAIEKRIHRTLDAAERVPPAALLERCRLDLARALRSEEKAGRRSWTAWWSAAGGWGFLSAAWLRPAGAFALVAIGFLGARWTAPGGPAPAESMSPSEPISLQVRYVEPSGSGRVRLVVDETRQRVFSGDLSDKRVQEMLLAAVRNRSDPGVRAESLDLLKQQGASGEVRDALLYALEHDPSDGVRLRALEGLRAQAADPAVRRALSRVLLTDQNPGVRSVAIDLLVQSRDEDVVATLQQMLQREQDSYLRLRGEKALEEMNAPVETF